MLAAWIKKKPFVVTYHNDITARGVNSYIAALYNRIFLPLVLKKAERIIITRTHFKSQFLDNYREKLIHIPPGVNTEQFKPVDYPKIGDLFFLSVLDEYHRYKGIEILFSAINQLKDKYPGIRVIVGGSGVQSDHYKKKAVGMGIAPNIVFAGYIPDQDLLKYYRGTSAFVLPSTDPTREGFGLVLLEAMACGRPVLTTDIAGMADDIKEFGSGIIIPRENPESLAKAISWFMENPGEAEAMGRAARKLIEERYDWKIITGRIEKIYEQHIR
jgi:glycosyltransferase involved in cell wall biosynthesis